MKIQAIYRLSDKSYPKAKLPGATKELCLRNFLKAFPDWYLDIILDNCGKETTEMAMDLVKNRKNTFVINTSCGNAGVLRYILSIWADRFKVPIPQAPHAIYVAEDDYLHDTNRNCQKLIEEGLEKSDYVTLYDHPDKYEFEYQYGEVGKILKTDSSHWKWTNSTTMTFACKTDALKRDKDIWTKYTSENHPHDHHIFVEIGLGKLISSIPGAACHTDLTYSEEKRKLLIDEFAIKAIEKEYFDFDAFHKEINELTNQTQNNPLKYLMGLVALSITKKPTPA